MILGARIGKDGQIYCRKAQQIIEAGRDGLFVPLWSKEPQTEVQNVEAAYNLYSVNAGGGGVVFMGWFVMDVDALSNTITLCPPIMADDGKTVSFLPDDYRKADRDEGWPFLVIDLNEICGYIFRKPNNRKALGLIPEVQKEAEPLVLVPNAENSENLAGSEAQ